MPMFEVIVEGQGIRLPMDGVIVTSFFRLVRLSAADVGAARAKALALVQADWDVGPHSKVNVGSTPTLFIEGVAQLPWWHRFLGKRRGYIFAPDDPKTGAV